MKRTHGCGELRAGDVGATVALAGWVHHRRDHGKVIFLDLRDASGTVQVVIHPEAAPEAAAAAGGVQREYCVRVSGAVAARKSGTENEKLPTGAVEIAAAELEVLSEAATPPFVIEDGVDADESIRLRHRYLDLRRPEMQRALRLRHALTAAIRRHLDDQGFVEIETPTLTRSTPEGARDFLVPSRIQQGTFFALPQSPQLFKQLLMVGGFERYYQIARCWRDEDLRADRQPEFTQLDVEMSFAEEQDVQDLTEAMIAAIWRQVRGEEVDLPFPRMSFDECMRRFGTDQPDIRYGMELSDVAAVFSDTSLGIFKGVLSREGGAMIAIGVPGGAAYDRKEVKRLERLAMERGAKGLAWFRYVDGGVDSPLAKHVTDQERDGLAGALSIGEGDLALLVADDLDIARRVLGGLRPVIARERGLVGEGQAFLWMTDPPLFEWDDDEGRYVSLHHPFTSPSGDVNDAIARPGEARARAYDLVLNGVELGGGSIRIHQRDVQERILGVLKRSPEEFDFLLEAFSYGPPPHGGIAFGVDRIAMMLAERGSIRDVIAFPKTQSGADPLTRAPTAVEGAQLTELGLRLRPE